jgi:hypothetical protein
VQLRSGHISQYRPVKSKGFHVKGRADGPNKDNILITSDFRKQSLARSYGLGVLSPEIDKPAELLSAYHYETVLDKLFRKKYLLIGYGADYLYYGPSPLPVRAPNPSPKAAKADPNFPAPPDTDELVLVVQWNEAATGGSETPARDTAMGDSALNYAAACYGKEWAEGRRWEWLHIVGHALGGNNEVGNLVAGTYDANTQMIPYEKRLLDATQRAGQYNPVEARYIVALFPDSWVAIDIRLEFHGCGEWVLPQTFRCQTALTFDKFQYDLWLKE